MLTEFGYFYIKGTREMGEAGRARHSEKESVCVSEKERERVCVCVC